MEPDCVYHADGFPAECILAPAQVRKQAREQLIFLPALLVATLHGGVPTEFVVATALRLPSRCCGQAMEWHDFNGALPLQQTRHLLFTTTRSGMFNGMRVCTDTRTAPSLAAAAAASARDDNPQSLACRQRSLTPRPTAVYLRHRRRLRPS